MVCKFYPMKLADPNQDKTCVWPKVSLYIASFQECMYMYMIFIFDHTLYGI